MRKFQVCVRAMKFVSFEVEAATRAAAQDAALELAENYDWDSVPLDSWHEIEKVEEETSNAA